MLLAAAFAQGPAKPDRNAFTFTRYKLNITIDQATALFTARGTVRLRNDSSTAQSVGAMQIGSQLKWASIKIGGTPVAFDVTQFPSDIDHSGAVAEAVFALPQPVSSGGTVEIEVGYSGNIRLETTRLTRLGMPADVARASDWDRIAPDYTLLRGVGHMVWYPVEMEPALLGQGNQLFVALGDFRARHAESSMMLTVSGAWSGSRLVCNCSSNGSAEFGKSEQDLLEFTRLGFDGPLLIIGKFDVLPTPQGSILSQPKQTVAAAKYADAAKKVAPEVTAWIRAPQLPVTMVEHPDAKAAAFESGPLLVTPFAENDKLVQLQLAHSLAHAAVPSKRAWIGEGLAHYAQTREREVQDGRKAAIEFLLDRLSALAIDEPEGVKAAPDSAARSLINTGDEVLYRTKSMFVWWMLHDMLGDDPLVKALKDYREADDKDPVYMQRLIEAHAHRNLDWFFADWVYRDRGLPDFRVSQVYPRQTLDKGYLVTVTIENLGDCGAEVPVRVMTKEGESVVRVEVMAKDKASARVTTQSLPLEVIVNDGTVPESDLTNNAWKAEAPK